MARADPETTCTDAELLLLGLIAEMPRHGYQLEQEIGRRSYREWTQIGFSSVYFVLDRLERKGLTAAEEPAGPKAKKTMSLTRAGRRALATHTRAALRTYRPTHPSVLLGMINWPVLSKGDAVRALAERGEAVDAEAARLATIRRDQQPLPDHVEVLFEFSIGQLQAEAAWISRTLDYMETKPWLEEE
jgi:DNA-binding PadR family transcriptional regulator